MGDMRFSERINSSIHFHSPDCTAFGNLRKRWRIVDGERHLIKAAMRPHGQEPVNEVVAIVLMKSQVIDCTKYGVSIEGGRL